MPFQPGQKANPTGIQGKHRSLFTNALNRALLRAGNKPEALQDEIEAAFEAEEYTVAQELIDTLIDLARNGDLQAIKLLIERHEGKAVERHESGAPGDFSMLTDEELDKEYRRILAKARAEEEAEKAIENAKKNPSENS